MNASGTVSSSVIRVMIDLANCVMRRIYETRVREAEHYVTMIVCWQQIVLGWLDKGFGGKGWECSKHIARYLLKKT